MSSTSHPSRDSAESSADGIAGATAAEIREHNRQLQFLSETFPEGVVYQYTVTAGGERLLTYLGRGAERIFGERPARLPADVEWLAARIVPEDQPGIDAAAARSRCDLSRFNHDVRIRTLDGAERWVSFRTQPRELADGAVVWDGVILDVTARRRDEDAVRRQAEFLAALNQTTLDLLGRRNVPDLLQALAQRAATLLRSAHAEISLLEDGDLVVRAFSQGREYLAGDRVNRGERALSWRAVDTLAPVVADQYHQHEESRAFYGTRGLHAVAIFPIVRDGVCVGVLGLGRDEAGVTYDQREIEEGTALSRMAALVLHNAAIHKEAVRETEARTAALRQSEERFRVLAEVSPVGIFSSDTVGRCTFVNRRWCEIAGLTPEQALGEGWKTALHPEDRTRIAAGWGEAVRAGEFSTAEYRFMRPDGTVTWLVGQARGQFTAEGVLSGYVGTITDVTKLKHADEERKKMEGHLRQSQKMESLGTLAGGIAHDFNNILNGTFGFVDLARLELPEGHSVHAWLDRIAASSQRARELVRQILTFSRKNEGERVPQRLDGVVSEALRLLRSSLPAMVTLESHISPRAPTVLADATQIHQVVLNLCTNAWHALPARGGRITVTLEPCAISAAQAAVNPELKAGPHLCLSVADNGTGIDAATLDHIFEPFFTTKQTGAGTGLGLAVVHGIVKSHGGSIVVRSTVGLGSTFEIYIPAVAAPQPEAPATPEPAIPRGRGERILVVDDDTVSGFVIEKLVESLGYTTTRCTRPEDALTRVRTTPANFDLVISDLAMPGMNGEELLEKIHQVRADLPMFIVSGYVENARLRIQQRGIARAVLRKPVTRDELARTIAAHVLRKS